MSEEAGSLLLMGICCVLARCWGGDRAFTFGGSVDWGVAGSGLCFLKLGEGKRWKIRFSNAQEGQCKLSICRDSSKK